MQNTNALFININIILLDFKSSKSILQQIQDQFTSQHEFITFTATIMYSVHQGGTTHVSKSALEAASRSTRSEESRNTRAGSLQRLCAHANARSVECAERPSVAGRSSGAAQARGGGTRCFAITALVNFLQTETERHIISGSSSTADR